jgi:hypothetical protein
MSDDGEALTRSRPPLASRPVDSRLEVVFEDARLVGRLALSADKQLGIRVDATSADADEPTGIEIPAVPGHSRGQLTICSQSDSHPWLDLLGLVNRDPADAAARLGHGIERAVGKLRRLEDRVEVDRRPKLAHRLAGLEDRQFEVLLLGIGLERGEVKVGDAELGVLAVVVEVHDGECERVRQGGNEDVLGLEREPG